MLPPVESPSPVVYHTKIQPYLFRAVLVCKRMRIADFPPDSDRQNNFFHWRKHYYGLWIMDFMTITCGLLWCFYQLFGLSFWRHPFTAEHPLLRHWCRDTFLQTWWRNKLIYILDGLSVGTFLANLIFGWIIPLSRPLLHNILMHAFFTKIAPDLGIETDFLHIRWYFETVKVTVSATFIKKKKVWNVIFVIWSNFIFILHCLGV